VHLIFTILSLAFAGDAEPILDLQRLLNGVYDRRATYDFRIDYTAAPRSALSETDAVWPDVFLREKRSIGRSRDV
jgi:hypothetical protein